MSHTPRQRILNTIDGHDVDHTPLSFLLFTELLDRCNTQFDYLTRLANLGCDPIAALPDVDWEFHPDVETETWIEPATPHPILHKTYRTPAGDLETAIRKTPDWPHGDDIPLMSDHIIPRAVKHLVTETKDLEPLQYILQPPTSQAIEQFTRKSAEVKQFADHHNLATRAGFNRLADTICWLAGCEQFAMLGLTDPDLFQAIIDIVAKWQDQFTEIYLTAKPDIIVDAQWYATTFLSPALYQQFLAPALVRRVDMIHEAGSRVCAIATSNVMPFLNILKTLDIDMLFGVDPMQGEWDFAQLKQQIGNDICLFGGINGYLQIVDGSANDVQAATEYAMKTLAPDGRFILSAVDNIRIDHSNPDKLWPDVWQNVQQMVDAWKQLNKP